MTLLPCDTHKAILDQAFNSIYTSKHDLRSSDTGLLTVPSTRLRLMGDGAFSSLAPKLWNSLPTEIRQAKSFGIYKSQLKTHFFRLAFNWFIVFFLLLLSYCVLSLCVLNLCNFKCVFCTALWDVHLKVL